MSRVQLALNVPGIDAAIDFDTVLADTDAFGEPSAARRRQEQSQ